MSQSAFRIVTLLSLSLFAGAGKPSLAAEPEKLNIIFFMVDDMGWMDSGVYGSTYYETPHIDRFATTAMRFTDACTANPLCSPTRASILTGKYPARLGFTTAAGHRPPRDPDAPKFPATAPPQRQTIQPISKRYLPLEEHTIAEALQEAGYVTAHMGKWHLGRNPEHWPDRQGFDVKFHGAPDPGPPSYFSPYGFTDGNVTPGPEGEYITDRLTEEAVAFLRKQADGGQPFLLHLWQYGVHGPWGHKESITRRFAEKKDPRSRQGNPIMASMLWCVDQSFGRVLGTLEELGIADKTVVIFFSDNGGNIHSNTKDDPKWDRISPDHRRWGMLQSWKKWAGFKPPTNNAPLRKGKAWLYEGGVRVPLIIRWPGVTEPGSLCNMPVISTDFYPTMLDMAGLDPRPEQHRDGVSLAPLLKGTGRIDREAIFNFFPHGGPGRPPGVSVRRGDWKLIRWFETSPQFPDQNELYNLADDIGESNNLAEEQPGRVEQLNALIDGFLERTGAAVPKPNPAYSEDNLQGWVAKGCTTKVEDGVLRVTAGKSGAFLATVRLNQLNRSGPLAFRIRIRASSGGPARFQWRTTAQEKFPGGDRQITQFNIPAKDGWQELTVRLPIDGRLRHVRLWLPADRGPVEFDRLRLQPPDEREGAAIMEWDF